MVRHCSNGSVVATSFARIHEGLFWVSLTRVKIISFSSGTNFLDLMAQEICTNKKNSVVITLLLIELFCKHRGTSPVRACFSLHLILLYFGVRQNFLTKILSTELFYLP